MEANMNRNTDEKQAVQGQRGTIRRVLAYSLYFKNELFLGILALGLAVLFELVSPLVIQYVMDNEMIKQNIEIPQILKYLAIYIVLSTLSGAFRYLSGIEFRITAMKVVQKLRLELYEKIQTLPISYFENQPAGTIVSKITNDTNAVQNLYVMVLGQFLVSAGYVIGVYIALYMLNPRFATLVLLFIPFFYVIFRIYAVKSQKYNGIIRSKISETNGAINEAVQGISIIQAFNSQRIIQENYERINEERFEQEIKMEKLDAALSYNVSNIVRNIGFMMVIYFFGSRALQDTNDIITVGLLYVYIEYLGTLFQQSHGIFEQIYQISRSGVASKQIFEILDREGRAVSEEKIDHIRGEVALKDVCFYYKNEDYVLRNIDIEAKAGQTIALVGHTGSGKSSIMNLLLKFYQPQSGTITIDGMDLKDLPAQAIRAHMGIVLQEPYLFTGTILSNITLGNPEISRERAEKALRIIGGEIVTRNLVQGIDEPVVEKGATLSAGQRQLISFARAMAHDPRILILDEATSAIDSETEQVIQKATEILMEGRTTFIIAHRLSTIKNADKIYLLEKGRVVESGDHEELIAKQGKYYDMYHTQMNVK